MKTYKYNGEEWYIDAQPGWMRALRWLITTGLEGVRWGPEGVSYCWKARKVIRLALRARGHRSRLWALYSAICPLSFFGHKITFQHFGFHISRQRDYLCIHWGHRGPRRDGWKVYASHNATPSAAHWWLLGPPAEVKREAQATVDRRNAERIEHETRYGI